MKAALFFGLCALLPGLALPLTAQDQSPTPQPGIEATLNALAITVQAEAYNRDCRPVHTLLYDSNYRAYLEAPNFSLDEQLVVITDYGTRYDNAGWQYVPQTISTVGLTAAYAWCEHGDTTALQLAVAQAEWLVKQAQDRGDFVTWLYNFPSPSFFVPAGWTSALGNGQAIVLLTQLYLLGGDQRYLDTAQQAVNSYRVDMAEGGVRSTLDDGSVVFEEYAYPDAPVSFVLNGHIIAVDSLAYFAAATGDSAAAALVDEGIQAVRNRLIDFDGSSTTFYSLGPVPWGSARTHYAHGIHVRGLFWMYTRTGDPTFLQYAFDWQRYKWPPLPADAYRDTVSPESFMAALPDQQRWLVEPADSQAFILDLRQVQPLRSFAYNMVGPYPADYEVAVSEDGVNWTNVESVSDSTQRHASIRLDDVAARFVRLSLGQLVRDNAYYERLSNGAYRDYLMVGVLRADGAAYWDEPVLLLTDGATDYDDAQFLRDNDPQTTLALPADAVLYADLRGINQLAAFNLQTAPEAETIARRAWAETSTDGQTWAALIAPEQATDVSLPGRIDLPTAAEPYRYLRLHLDGDAPLALTEVQPILAAP